jgi:hypothetical protein
MSELHQLQCSCTDFRELQQLQPPLGGCNCNATGLAEPRWAINERRLHRVRRPLRSQATRRQTPPSISVAKPASCRRNDIHFSQNMRRRAAAAGPTTHSKGTKA